MALQIHHPHHHHHPHHVGLHMMSAFDRESSADADRPMDDADMTPEMRHHFIVTAAAAAAASSPVAVSDSDDSSSLSPSSPASAASPLSPSLRKRQASAPLNHPMHAETDVDNNTASAAAAAPASSPAAPASNSVSASSSASNSIASDPRQRYFLQKELHRSIYGKLYLGTDHVTGRSVALKVSVKRLLDSHMSLNGVTVLEDPRKETDILERVQGHANVSSLVAVHEDDDLHWMAQEYVPGGDMFDALSRVGHYTPDQARSVFLQVLQGLSHLHSRDVAHLDVSLENLLVDSDGTIKICDFGLARVVENGRKISTASNSGASLPGKYGYMAPEVLAGKDFDGFKADVFSAGVVLFTLLTGHPPFEFARLHDRRYEMIARGQLEELLRILDLQKRVPRAAAEVISAMLRADPTRRPTVDQVLAHPWLQL